MATATLDVHRPAPPAPARARLDIALLGLGQIGAAVAREITDESSPLAAQLRLLGALVRDPGSPRAISLPASALLTPDADALFARNPAIVIEALGGVEPAFTLVRRALERGIAVVTANKSLLAAHGPELAALAASTGAPLLYEASVLAGVPFLGTLARRPHAARVSRITGIVNGTSNFILTEMHGTGAEWPAALAAAQHRGLAEPNPSNDIGGIDAAEKLSVLLQHFGWGHARRDAIETTGIAGLRAADARAAQDLGGVLKPIAFAERLGDRTAAFAGPAFVPSASPLARVDGADNAIILRNGYGELFYGGPGAGPDATAATILDDVLEIVERRSDARAAASAPAQRSLLPAAPETAWFLRLSSDAALPAPEAIADILGSHGIWLQRTSSPPATDGVVAAWAITWRASRERLARALSALTLASRCDAAAIRALEG